MLFVNGTNDMHYPLDSCQKSADCVAGDKQMRIQVKMPHGHEVGWASEEIGISIDAHCRGCTLTRAPGRYRLPATVRPKAAVLAMVIDTATSRRLSRLLPGSRSP